MNAKTEQQIANLKTQTIGVEIEMNHITRKNAAKLAADFFGTGRYEDTAHRNGYYTWSAWDAEGREWKFQRDVSIAGADSEKCELVTPILHYEDIEILQELVRRLRKAGAISHAGVGAGVHIHIGANGHTPQTLRNSIPIGCDIIAERLTRTFWSKSIGKNLARWHNSPTSGTPRKDRITAEINTTTTADTIC